jgi:hypothetical protein
LFFILLFAWRMHNNAIKARWRTSSAAEILFLEQGNPIEWHWLGRNMPPREHNAMTFIEVGVEILLDQRRRFHGRSSMTRQNLTLVETMNIAYGMEYDGWSKKRFYDRRRLFILFISASAIVRRKTGCVFKVLSCLTAATNKLCAAACTSAFQSFDRVGSKKVDKDEDQDRDSVNHTWSMQGRFQDCCH